MSMENTQAIGLSPGDEEFRGVDPSQKTMLDPRQQGVRNAPESACETDTSYRVKRLRKSSLLKLNLDGIEKPCIKAAEHIDEYKQAFKLVHDEYARSGYISPSPEHPFFYSLFSFLPETRVFIFQSQNHVIGTLTQIFDTPGFGLPMDKLYKKELDALRIGGRRIAELSSFVTSTQFRMRNIMVYLCKIMFTHSHFKNVDDICIMVNPKHVNFYTKMFLFEPFGPELFYDKVQAPAVPLRIDMKYIAARVREKYANFDEEHDLFTFFFGSNHTANMLHSGAARRENMHTPREIKDFFCRPQGRSLAA